MAYAKPNRQARQRAKYGTQQPAEEAPGHRTGRQESMSPNDRPAGELNYRAKLQRGYGAHGGTHRIMYSRESGGTLIITSKSWTGINKAELQKLQAETLSVTFHDGDKRVERLLRKFAFETADGEPVALPEIPDRVIESNYAL